jgi:predicted Zn-dependent peptidase
MISYYRTTLENGLRVLVHEDQSTPMVAVNVLYDVGARDESVERTGFAHLFEHLMFSGSLHIPNFDNPIQSAGGENNAFTNSDITNFYDVVPADNIETAFWLESDRMLGLNFSEKALETQQKVVVEEFKETCLNEPYGDVWHHLLALAYQQHPYRWPTIGLVPEHVEQATLAEVKAFFYKYYRPNNAILAVAGNCTAPQVEELAKKWFGEIPRSAVPTRNLTPEPPQTEHRRKTVTADVPLDAIFMAFHAPKRISPEHYAVDLLSDILCNGQSSRLFRQLVKNEGLFTEIDCYITGTADSGLFIVEGKPADGVSLETAEAAIWNVLENIKNIPVPEIELQKIKNKAESTLVFSELSALNKAMNLAYFEAVGDIDLINREEELYQTITVEDIQTQAQAIFRKENCSVLIYKALNPQGYDDEEDDDEDDDF